MRDHSLNGEGILRGHAHLKYQGRGSEFMEEVRQRRRFLRPVGCRRLGRALSYARACRPQANRKFLVDQTFVGCTHGAARDTELSRQILPGRQPRARGEPPRFNGFSDRPVNLGGQRCSSGTIEVDGKHSHRAMVQSELPILVLFHGQARAHLVATTSGLRRRDQVSRTIGTVAPGEARCLLGGLR